MQFLSHLLTSLALLGFVSAIPATSHGGSGLPVVDLGYVKHRATEYNKTAGVYVYRNIRFAAPPVGERRLRKPQPPLKEAGIQDGHYGRSTACAQPNGTALLGDEDCLVSYTCFVEEPLADVRTVFGYLRTEEDIHEERESARACLVSLFFPLDATSSHD